MHTIGVFDSGVGGLGILKEIALQLPSHGLVYFADNINMPYGNLSVTQIQQLMQKNLEFVINKHQIKLAVIACNTASTASLSFLRQHFSLPIVGVVPVVKPACELTKTKKIAMFSTPATAQSAYLQELIATYANGVEVLNIGCLGLADLIEAGHLDDDVIKAKVKEFVEPVRSKGVDVIGLACTHYPFIRDHIANYIGPDVTILDSNQAVARQVARMVKQHDIVGYADGAERTCRVYATKGAETFERIGQQLVGNLVSNVTLISLSRDV